VAVGTALELTSQGLCRASRACRRAAREEEGRREEEEEEEEGVRFAVAAARRERGEMIEDIVQV